MAHQVTRSGFPVDPELLYLEDQPGALAAQWRGTHSQQDRQPAIVQSYHATLVHLSQLGWEPDVANLEYEETSPDALLPEAYRRHRTAPVTLDE